MKESLKQLCQGLLLPTLPLSTAAGAHVLQDGILNQFRIEAAQWTKAKVGESPL
jgi:hypothetical protein